MTQTVPSNADTRHTKYTHACVSTSFYQRQSRRFMNLRYCSQTGLELEILDCPLAQFPISPPARSAINMVME